MVSRRVVFVVAALAVCLDGAAGGSLMAERPLERLADVEFWRLSTALSEPNGWFRSDNLLSNEAGYQSVIPRLPSFPGPRGVYLGVGPEQNFTYIAAIAPLMAFIVDIRRGNRDLHLMYKAIFELSPTRADFLSRLFARAPPEGLDADASVDALFAALERADRDAGRYTENLEAIRDHLLSTRHLPLSRDELDGIEHVYGTFVRYGPALRYSSSGSALGSSTQPTYAELMRSTDDTGTSRSFLATEAAYRVVRELELRNLVIPVVGNFGGPTALRSIGAFLQENDAHVSVFYLSNVEQYLRQDGLWDEFCGNVSALPATGSSTLIRAVRGGEYGRRSGGLATELGRLAEVSTRCQ